MIFFVQGALPALDEGEIGIELVGMVDGDNNAPSDSAHHSQELDSQREREDPVCCLPQLPSACLPSPLFGVLKLIKCLQTTLIKQYAT